jgi:predicted RNA-binding protein
MCEAKAYAAKNGDEEQIMQDVVLVQPEGDAYLLVNLLGEQKPVQGRIERIGFLKHTVRLSQAQESTTSPD